MQLINIINKDLNNESQIFEWKYAVGQLNENPVHKYELVVFNIGELDLVVFIDVENEQLVFNDIEKTTSKSLI